MLEINFTLFELLIVLSFFIILFIYSAFSTDLTTTFLSLIIFLIFIIPFYGLLDIFKSLIYSSNLEGVFFFQIILFYSSLIPCFIGLFLFVEVIYLFFNS